MISIPQQVPSEQRVSRDLRQKLAETHGKADKSIIMAGNVTSVCQPLIRHASRNPDSADPDSINLTQVTPTCRQLHSSETHTEHTH